jgi:hypothetical protein
MAIGGQLPPSSTVGDNAEWKYDQKIAKNTNSSVTINKAMPSTIPRTTSTLWSPKYLPSQATSRNHRDMRSTTNTPQVGILLNKEPNAAALLSASTPRAILSTVGQGDLLTRWKGCAKRVFEHPCPKFDLAIILIIISFIASKKCPQRPQPWVGTYRSRLSPKRYIYLLRVELKLLPWKGRMLP